MRTWKTKKQVIYFQHKMVKQHRITAICILVQKKENMEGKKWVTDVKSFQNPMRLFVWRPRDNPLWLYPLSHSFFMKGNTGFQMTSFISLFLAFMGAQQPSFVLSSLFTFYFKLAMFLPVENSQESCGSPMYVTRIHSIRQVALLRLFHRSSHLYS